LGPNDKARVLFRKLLLEKVGCEVIAVNGFFSCLKALADAPVDLALIDYHLTGEMDGEHLARVICSTYPAIALTMLTGDPTIPNGARESGDVLLTKGTNKSIDLREAIEALVPNATLHPGCPNIIPGSSQAS
jgi:CheY-like chemotaxis protein